jgi:hypothetical protein
MQKNTLLKGKICYSIVTWCSTTKSRNVTILTVVCIPRIFCHKDTSYRISIQTNHKLKVYSWAMH